MNDASWLIIIGGGTLFLNLILGLIGGTWVLSRSHQQLLEKIDERFAAERITTESRVNKLNDNFTAEIRKLDQEIENNRSWFGESMTAIRAKITETELWNRDNFVSKGTFKVVIEEMKAFFTRLEDKMDIRFNKIDDKLDANKN